MCVCVLTHIVYLFYQCNIGKRAKKLWKILELKNFSVIDKSYKGTVQNKNKQSWIVSGCTRKTPSLDGTEKE